MKNKILVATLAALTITAPAIASADSVKITTNNPSTVRVETPNKNTNIIVANKDNDKRTNNYYGNNNNNNHNNNHNDNRYNNGNNGNRYNNGNYNNNNNKPYNNGYNNGYNYNNGNRIVSSSIISAPKRNIRNGCGWGRAYFKYANGRTIKGDAYMCVTRYGKWNVVDKK